MRKIISRISAIFLLVVSTLSFTTIAKSAEFFTIGTGGPTGVYFQTGNAICKMLHKYATSSEHGRSKANSDKHTDVLRLQQEDLIIILDKLKKVNFNLVLLNLTGSIMHTMVQVNGKENNTAI